MYLVVGILALLGLCVSAGCGLVWATTQPVDDNHMVRLSNGMALACTGMALFAIIAGTCFIHVLPQ